MDLRALAVVVVVACGQPPAPAAPALRGAPTRADPAPPGADRPRPRVASDPRSTRAAGDALDSGERAFAAGDLVGAERHYRQALRFPMAATAAYARYKLAWVYYNLGRHPEALAGFVAVAATAGEPLRRAAVTDTVRVYAEVGDPARALGFFQQLDRGRAGALTLALAEQLAEAGKDTAAATVARAALPVLDAAAGCRAQLLLVTGGLRRGRPPAELLAELAALAARPRPGDCGDDAATLATEVAAAWHAEQRSLRSDPSAVIAAWRLAERLATTAAGRARAVQAQAELAGAAKPSP